jgi:hypothetical protein
MYAPLHARLRNAHTLFAPLTLQPLACCRAARAQTVAMLPTGAGKTLIAAWLIKHYADTLLAGRASSHVSALPMQRLPARRCCVVFLCPTKLLVRQQAAVLRAATPLAVGEFTGDAGVDAWDAATWAARLADAEVVVATPQVVVDALAKSFLQARGAARGGVRRVAARRARSERNNTSERVSCCSARAQMRDVVLLVLDECHHATKKRVASRARASRAVPRACSTPDAPPPRDPDRRSTPRVCVCACVLSHLLPQPPDERGDEALVRAAASGAAPTRAGPDGASPSA